MTGNGSRPYAAAVTALPSDPPPTGGARARRTADSRMLILEAAVACLVPLLMGTVSRVQGARKRPETATRPQLARVLQVKIRF